MHELLTPAEMAEIDRLAGQGGALMQAAGRAVARAVAARFAACPTLVLCGPGNNGGDGYVAARLLAQGGWPVRVAAVAPPRPGSDAADAARLWRGPCAHFQAAEASRAELVIDAVFGAGLARDVLPETAGVLAAARRLVAVDVPSGVDGGTGAVRGAAAQAELTVTFFRAKPGHFLLPGRARCGELVLADIGIPPALLARVQPRAWRNGPDLWRLPVPGAEDHKYRRGTVTLLGGGAMPGATRLAAAAARRVGAGLVSIAAGDAAPLYRATEPGLIVLDAPLDHLLEDERRQVWLCGPGLGAEAARAALPVLLAARRQVVADADSFTAFAGAPAAFRGAAVLTPHAGEFARVFGDPGDDRLAAARAAAARTGAVLLLKGSDTIIAAPDGRIAINVNAPPWLGTAGSGDVLAGAIAGLLAQGMPAWDAAAAGAFLHGEAGRRCGAGLIAEDLPAALRPD